MVWSGGDSKFNAVILKMLKGISEHKLRRSFLSVATGFNPWTENRNLKKCIALALYYLGNQTCITMTRSVLRTSFRFWFLGHGLKP